MNARARRMVAQLRVGAPTDGRRHALRRTYARVQVIITTVLRGLARLTSRTTRNLGV